jgi:poly-beta-1,6-N-acetyl-D-glucosamine synthase
MIARLFWIFISGIAYTYLGFPLLLSLLSRLKPEPKIIGGQFPDVTLIISAYKEGNVIGAKLENSLSLDYPLEQLQILVAVEGEEDDTQSIVEQFATSGIELSGRNSFIQIRKISNLPPDTDHEVI